MSTISAVTRLIEAAKVITDSCEFGYDGIVGEVFEIRGSNIDMQAMCELKNAILAMPTDAGEYCMVPTSTVEKCVKMLDVNGCDRLATELDRCRYNEGTT